MEVNVPVDPIHQQQFNNQQRLFDAQSRVLLQQLTTATPAQIATWMTANVTNFTQVQSVLTDLALGLRYVYLKELGK